MDVINAREQFPYLKHGQIYFNHASSGPLCTPVYDIIRDYLDEKSETHIDNYTRLIAVTKEAKSEIASLINASPDRIAFVDNTTNGVNVLASGIKLKPGDHILLNNLEFPANVYPYLNLQKKGVIIDFVKSHNGIVTAENIIDAIVPETKLISVSQVQFLTGYRISLEKLGKVCRDKKIILAVDAIQGLGAVKLDIVKDNVDFISAGSQKWLLGLQGLGFIYVSEMLQDKIEQDCVGWMSVNDAWNLLNYDLKLKKSADRYQGGTLNTIGIYALNASLKFLKQYDFNEIEKHVVDNSLYFMQRLDEIGFKPVLEGIDKENIAGITSFKDDESITLFDALTKENIHGSLRLGHIRMAPHFYNTREEIDRAIDVLKNVR